MNSYKYCVIILFSVVTIGMASNTEIKFERITTKSGLSQGSITAVTQDSTGFMWFGTPQGLNRYDGYEIKKIYTIPGHSNSLPDDNISALTFSPDSILWIGTNSKGLVGYDPLTGKFNHFASFLYNSDSDSYPKIKRLLSNSKGSLWLSTDDGRLVEIDYSLQNSVVKLSNSKIVYNYSTVKNIGINDLCFLSGTDLLVGSDLGLFLLSIDSNLKVIRNECLLSDPIFKIRLVGDKIFLIGEYEFNKVFYSEFSSNEISPNTFEFHRFYPDDSNKSSGVPDVVGYKNIVLFNLDPYRLIGYTADLRTKVYEQDLSEVFDNISRFRISSLFLDKNKSLWALTNGLGILAEQNKSATFNTLKNVPENPSSISPTSLRQLVEDPDQGGIWITGYDGISLFNPSSGKVTRYPFNKPVFSLALIPENSKHFLIGTDGSGLYMGNKESGKTKLLNLVNNDIPLSKSSSIFYIYVDQNNTIWFSALEGLMSFKLPASLDNVPPKINYNLTSVAYNKLETSSRVAQIYPAGDSLFYLTTENHGILKYNKNTDSYSEIKYDSSNPNSLSSDNVKTIFCSSDGTYWAGTNSGLNKWAADDFKNFRNKFERIFISDGLPNNLIYGILEDNYKNLWLSTNLGLCRFNPSEFSFNNFSNSDGLANDEFNTNSYLKTKSGILYFGGIYGLTYFNPENIVEQQSDLKVVYTGLSILNNTRTITKDIPYTSHLELTSDENIFSVSFSALNFHQLQNTEYSYQFEGQDSSWTDLGRTRKVTFTNVSPGDYKLRVRARTSLKKWSGDYSELSISILPPLWQTWWMYTIYTLLILIGIYIAVKYELGRQRHKQNAEIEKVRAANFMEINRAKSDFFANISHELRTPLTLVLGMLESVKSVISSRYDDNELEEKIDIAYKSAKKQSSMVNQILNLTKIDSGEVTLNASVKNIEPFIRSICSSFESLAKLQNLKFTITSDHSIIPVYFDPDKIEKIMNNLLSNAIKFTPDGGKISVSISSGLDDSENHSNIDRAGLVDIVVKDSGIGIPEEKLAHIFDRFFQADSSSTRRYEGIGIGLNLTRELVELHSGKIKVESVFGEGTTFTVSLPIEFNGTPDANIASDDLFAGPAEVSVSNTIDIPRESAEESGKNSILIIEDNSDLRFYIKDTLKSDYVVLEAADGKEGIETAEREIPDLIITDAMMPNTDGYEMTKVLRESNATSHIPIIMLTARAAEEDKLSGLEAGVDAYITKPFSTKELILRVQKLLELREKLYNKIGDSAFVNPLELKINSPDQQFLDKLKDTVLNNIGNENFSIPELAENMALSERQLRRKLSALINISPVAYIRKHRMRAARELLLNGNGNVSQVSLDVGYSNIAAFSKAFKEEYGTPPSKIVR